jgi:hypothetical protein
MQDHPLAGAGDVREHPVCDRMVLGTVQQRVGYTHLQPQPLRQPLQVFLEQVLRRTGDATTIAKHQQPFRPGMHRSICLLPPQRHAVASQIAGVVARVVARVEVDVHMIVHHSIDPMRKQLPLAHGAATVVEDVHGIGKEGRASRVQIPWSYLFSW